MAREEVFLSLGSNQGDSLANLLRATVSLQKKGLEILDVSSVYQTEPIGYIEQADFLNMVLRGSTDLTPHELLEVCQEVEGELQRVRTIRWGPRTIDIDIIFYGRQKIASPELTIPHPRFAERAFVLVPLQEIAPEIITELGLDIPGQKITLLVSRADVKMMLKQFNN